MYSISVYRIEDLKWQIIFEQVNECMSSEVATTSQHTNYLILTMLGFAAGPLFSTAKPIS